MKTTFKLSALALVMALTACGSSGGGDSTSSKPVVENTNSSSQNPATTNGNGAGNTASQTETTTPVNETKTYGGTHWSLANNYKPISNRALGESKEDKLIVEGQEIDLSAINSKGEQKLTNSRYGYFLGAKEITNHNLTIYSQGVLTNDMPTAGTATYKGQAYYSSESLGNQRPLISSEFDVDFGAKTVKGKLSGSNINVTLPTATISGNSFAGKDGNDNNVQGNFFGSQAAELGGIFSGEQIKADGKKEGISASFGATKQK